MSSRLIIHGGAWNIPTEHETAHLDGLRYTIEQVWPKLQAGCSALDAVEMAVSLLEEDPTYDSGRGAYLNAVGEIELDAMIMDGRTLDFGAIAAVQNLLHPVQVARRLMERSEFRLLVGAGAQAFARAQGFTEVHPTTLLTARELQFFEKIRNNPDFRSHHPFQAGEGPSDTVGAVALDHDGNLAAATSTGGTARKHPGRVGDSPIPGAGAYADNEAGAVSATGWGESILRVLLSKCVTDGMANGLNADQAAKAGIATLGERVGGLGGVIGIDSKGHYGWAYNTPKMAFAYWDTERNKIFAQIKSRL